MPGCNCFGDGCPRSARRMGFASSARWFFPDWRPNRDYRRSYSSRAEDGGVLRDLIHEIDYAVWLFGRPQSVFAKLFNLGRLGIEAEETVDLYWQAMAGYGISIHLDYLSRMPGAQSVLMEIRATSMGLHPAAAGCGPSKQRVGRDTRASGS